MSKKVYRAITTLPLVTEFFFEEHTITGLPLVGQVPVEVPAHSIPGTVKGQPPVIVPAKMEVVPQVVGGTPKMTFPKLWLNDETHSLMVGVNIINAPICITEVQPPEWWEKRAQ